MNSSALSETENNVIFGRNPVYEAIKSGRGINSIFIANANHNKSLDKIISLAKSHGIPIKITDKRRLDELSKEDSHQGIVAVVSSKKYCTIDDILNLASDKNQKPFIIIADKIQDPHNLGSIIRSAECAGAHGVIIPKYRCASLTSSVDRVSCGALEYVQVARVNNISSAINYLKSKNVWVYGSDMDGEIWHNHDFTKGTALIIGSEGEGISRLVKQKCDFIVSLPLLGNINSLNASVSAGVLMYEVVKQRGLNYK